MFYVTTSRKPSLTTKRLCRLLAALLPRGVYENRGKKGIEDIFERAKSLGKRRALLVYEQNGNPSSISFMKINGSWEWLEPEIKISGVKMGTAKIREQPEGMRISGERKRELARLFDFDEAECGECDEDEMTEIRAGAKEITFSRNKKIMLVLKL
ncbi:MAG: hypothetical protein AB1468_02565 [Candidatus Micrarchaeota archaeon]